MFSHQLNVNGIALDAPETVLIQVPSGLWNFSSLGAKTSALPRTKDSANGQMALSIKSLKINGARLSLTQGGGQPQVLDNVSIEVKRLYAPIRLPLFVVGERGWGWRRALELKPGRLTRRTRRIRR